MMGKLRANLTPSHRADAGGARTCKLNSSLSKSVRQRRWTRQEETRGPGSSTGEGKSGIPPPTPTRTRTCRNTSYAFACLLIEFPISVPRGYMAHLRRARLAACVGRAGVANLLDASTHLRSGSSRAASAFVLGWMRFPTSFRLSCAGGLRMRSKGPRERLC